MTQKASSLISLTAPEKLKEAPSTISATGVVLKARSATVFSAIAGKGGNSFRTKPMTAPMIMGFFAMPFAISSGLIPL